MEVLIAAIAGLDPMVVAVLVGVLVGLMVWALLKKMAKLAIFLVVVGIVVTVSSKGIQGLKEEYWVDYNGNDIVLTIAGKTMELPVDQVKSIEIDKSDSKKVRFEAVLSTGQSYEISIDGLPGKVAGEVLKNVAEKANVTLVEK